MLGGLLDLGLFLACASGNPTMDKVLWACHGATDWFFAAVHLPFLGMPC